VAVTVEVNTLGIHDWNLHVLYDAILAGLESPIIQVNVDDFT
jgi:hypothetical protein